MNVPLRHQSASQKTTIVDCDIHPAYRTPKDLFPFLPARWREHMATFGEHLRQGLSGQLAWPRMMASGTTRKATTQGRPSRSANSMARFCAERAPASSPAASRCVISGSSTVPTAMPITPIGNWSMRSA